MIKPFCTNTYCRYKILLYTHFESLLHNARDRNNRATPERQGRKDLHSQPSVSRSSTKTQRRYRLRFGVIHKLYIGMLTETTDLLFVVQVSLIVFVFTNCITCNCALKIEVFLGFIQRSYVNTLLSLKKSPRNRHICTDNLRIYNKDRTSKVRKKCRPGRIA